MDGIFIRKKTNFFLVVGILFIAIYLAILFADPGTVKDAFSVLIVGVMFSLLAVPSLLHNRGAYFHISDTHVKAKYHLFGKLDCQLQDIEFVQPQINALMILLKNGKRLAIMGLENPWELSSAIRRHNFKGETEPPDSLQKALNQAKAKRKRACIWFVVCMALMFANIFITVLLTGERDVDEFNGLDWKIFTVFCVVELATIAVLFVLAMRFGKLLLPIDIMKYRLRNATITAAALSSNHVLGVYTDVTPTGRLVVCGYPGDNSVYYYVQRLVNDTALVTTFTSEVYESVDALPDDLFDALIDITELFNL